MYFTMFVISQNVTTNFGTATSDQQLATSD